jgi:hypothetical protein
MFTDALGERPVLQIGRAVGGESEGPGHLLGSDCLVWGVVVGDQQLLVPLMERHRLQR